MPVIFLGYNRIHVQTNLRMTSVLASTFSHLPFKCKFNHILIETVTSKQMRVFCIWTSSKLKYIVVFYIEFETVLPKKMFCSFLLQKIPEEFNVFSLVQEMRTQRHSAVQTKVILSLEHHLHDCCCGGRIAVIGKNMYLDVNFYLYPIFI